MWEKFSASNGRKAADGLRSINTDDLVSSSVLLHWADVRWIMGETGVLPTLNETFIELIHCVMNHKDLINAA